MEEKEKEILDRNYHLLVHNIILTEEFYNQLRWNQVLPDSMIDDIQVCLVRKKSRHGQKHIKFKFKIKKYVIPIYSFVSYILYSQSTMIFSTNYDFKMYLDAALKNVIILIEPVKVSLNHFKRAGQSDIFFLQLFYLNCLFSFIGFFFYFLLSWT